MKKSLLIFFVFAALSFSSCSDDDDQLPEGSLNVEATVNGQEWKASGNSRVTSVAGVTIFAIGAGAVDKSNIAITLDGEKTGTFDLNGRALYTDAAQTVNNATSGTITITKLENNKVSGTFSFRASPMVGSGPETVVENGKFTDINIMK
tara:strand:+ start:67 stop:513 length:447 start_codon:yes stop_codon:yes gene_type:complete